MPPRVPVTHRQTAAIAGAVVLDTNVVLDWLVFADASAAAVGAAITSGSLAWLVTPRMHAELRAVLQRPLSSTGPRPGELR